MKWLNLRAMPSQSSDGKVTWFGIMLDVTKERELEIEVEHQVAVSKHHAKMLEKKRGIWGEFGQRMFLIME